MWPKAVAYISQIKCTKALLRSCSDTHTCVTLITYTVMASLQEHQQHQDARQGLSIEW